MRILHNRVLALLGATTLLVVALEASTYAATGKSLLLGRSNSANKMTTITRTTPGAPLRLASRPGSPPLSVNSTQRVPGLNADSVDGLSGQSLQSRASVFTDGAGGPRGTTEQWSIPVTPGTYAISYTVGFTAMTASPAAPASAICYVQTGGASPTPYTAIQSVTSVGGFSAVYANASSTVQVATPDATQLVCIATTSFETTIGVPVQIAVTRTDGLTTAPLTSLGRPITPKADLGR